MQRIILSVIIFFLITANAYADCAWILWINSELMTSSKNEGARRNVEWQLVKAWPSFNECDGHKRHVWTVYAKRAEQQRGEGENVSFEFLYIEHKPDEQGGDFLGGGTTYKFQCIPESIDPRGK